MGHGDMAQGGAAAGLQEQDISALDFDALFQEGESSSRPSVIANCDFSQQPGLLTFAVAAKASRCRAACRVCSGGVTRCGLLCR